MTQIGRMPGYRLISVSYSDRTLSPLCGYVDKSPTARGSDEARGHTVLEQSTSTDRIQASSQRPAEGVDRAEGPLHFTVDRSFDG